MPTPRKHATAAARQAAYRQRQQAADRTPTAADARVPAARALGPVRWRRLLGAAQAELATVAAELAVVYAQRSACWQESERGEAHLAREETLREVLATLEDLGEEFAP